MTKKRRKVAVLGVILVIFGVGIGVLAASGALGRVFGSKSGETAGETEEGSEEALNEAYGYIEKETVAGLVAKFNQAVNGAAGVELLTADEGSMTVHEEKYWYPLDEGVALVVVPVKFNNSTEKDVAATGLIYVDEKAAGREKAKGYFECLVRANDEKLSAEEAKGLITEAEGLREEAKMANRGGGIFVAVQGAEGHEEYQVVRSYRE